MDLHVLKSLSYGMYAVGVKDETKASACIVNTVVQITAADPVLVAVSIHHDNYSHGCIQKEGYFTISVLSEETSGTVIGALGFNSGRDTNKLNNVRHKILREGLPVIKENCCCWLLCKVTGKLDTPTHTVFLAEVVAGSDTAVGKPMTYEYYRKIIKGTAPRNAPTYLPPDPNRDDNDGERFMCTVCRYVYSDKKVSFEELPDDWVCPVCGMPKTAFIRQ